MKRTTNNDNNCSDQLSQLNIYSGKYSQWIKVIAANDGLLTHELGDYGLKSNNSHNMSQFVNPRIIPKGYVVAKIVHTLPSKSWSWHVWPVGYAINQPISKTLRATIFSYMEAANDETPPDATNDDSQTEANNDDR
jgi:hypothetical protein